MTNKLLDIIDTTWWIHCTHEQRERLIKLLKPCEYWDSGWCYNEDVTYPMGCVGIRNCVIWEER